VYGPSDVVYARDRVASPATALLVLAGIALALQLVALPINILQLNGAVPFGQPAGVPFALEPAVGVGSSVVGILLAAVVIVGAVRMRNLESYGLAMAAAVITLIPCTSPCCLLGLPFGIWALVVLSDDRVKAAFRS
jgi:hypothetical protein